MPMMAEGLVERHSSYVMLANVANRESGSVVTALIEQSRCLPDELYKSLTYFPKGTDLSIHPQERLNEIARELNDHE